MKSDVLRVVLIGAGGIGRFHAQLWRNIPQAKLVGVYDRSDATAQSVAHESGLERIYSSLEEALAEPTVDAVDICTPNRYHTPIVIAALEAGKHCLCEKPLALTATEIEQMIAVRDRCGKLLMTAQHMRFEQSFGHTPTAHRSRAVGRGVLCPGLVATTTDGSHDPWAADQRASRIRSWFGPGCSPTRSDAAFHGLSGAD